MKVTSINHFDRLPGHQLNQNINYPRPGKTSLKIPINQISQYANFPAQINIDLTVQCQSPETSLPPSTNKYLQKKSRRSSNTPSKPSFINKCKLVKCNICEQLINQTDINQHYFNHKLNNITSNKVLQSKTNYVSTMSKYNTGILTTQRKQKSYTKNSFQDRNQYPLRTTDIELDELINSIKMQNIINKNNKLIGIQQSIMGDKTNRRHQQYLQQCPSRKQNMGSKSKSIYLNTQHKSPMKYLNSNNRYSQDPLLTDIAVTQECVQSRYLSSKVLSKRKLSLCKDIQKQMFFSRQKQSKLSYKFQRQNNRKNTSYSSTKIKVPLNILAQNQ